MTENEKAITKIITPFISIYPESKLDSVGIAMYAKALSYIPADIVKAAMIKVMQTSKFFPKPAEIIAEAENMGDYLKKIKGEETLPTPGEAWQMVMEQIRRYGKDQTWEVPYEVDKAVKQFGKYDLCMCESKDIHIVRAQFMKLYTAILEDSKEAKRNKMVFECLGDPNIQKLINKSEQILLQEKADYENRERFRYF